MPITLNSETVQTLRTELTTLLRQYGQSKGITFNIGTIRYNPSGFRFKLEGNVPYSAAEAQDVERATFQRNCVRYGIPASIYGTRVYVGTTGVTAYKVVGLTPRGKVIIMNSLGKKFRTNFLSLSRSPVTRTLPTPSQPYDEDTQQ